MIGPLRRAGRASVAGALLVAAAATACSPGPPAGTGTAASPLASAPPSAAAATAAGPSAAASGPQEPCSQNDGVFCPMGPGEFRSTAFEGGVSFSLPQAWQNTDNAPDLIALFDQFDIVDGTSWLEIIGGPVSEGAETPPYAEVGDLVAPLDAIDGLTITSVEGRDFGAFPAQVYDVEHTGSNTATLFTYAETSGQYYLEPGATVRIYWLDIAGRPVLVTAEAVTAAFPEFLDAIEPFLTSITFGD